VPHLERDRVLSDDIVLVADAIAAGAFDRYPGESCA
jgi:hypothetical protein